MDKYKELKGSKIKTVGELISELSKFNSDTKLKISDADLGGYDVSNANYLVINTCEDNTISFGHLEYQAWHDYTHGLLTREQYKEIIEEES